MYTYLLTYAVSLIIIFKYIAGYLCQGAKKYMQYFLSEMQLKYTVLSLIKIDNLLKEDSRFRKDKL